MNKRRVREEREREKRIMAMILMSLMTLQCSGRHMLEGVTWKIYLMNEKAFVSVVMHSCCSYAY